MASNELEAKVKDVSRGLISFVGVEAITEASKYASTLKDIVQKQNLFTEVNGKEFVHVEGWTTLGTMLGVLPDLLRLERVDKDNPKKIQGYLVEIVKWNKYAKKNETYEKFIRPAFFSKKTMKIVKDENGNELREVEEIKYLAEVQLITQSGARLGRAIALCSNLEDGKLLNQEYSIASMAQTRATGKAYRLPFSWIMTLAGYAPTPFEDRESVTIGADEPIKDAEVIQTPEKTPENPKTETKTPASTPKTESKSKTRDVPTDPQKQKEMWSDLLKHAKNYGIDVTEQVLKKAGSPKPPTMSWLPKLIPILDALVTTKIEASERDGDAVAE